MVRWFEASSLDIINCYRSIIIIIIIIINIIIIIIIIIMNFQRRLVRIIQLL